MIRLLYAMAAAAMLALPAASRAESPDPGVEQASHKAVSPECAGKVCVTEMKQTTKVIYSSAIRYYCKPHKSLMDILKGRSCSECEGYNNCEVWTKKVLIKHVVPGKEKPVCVLKDCGAPGVETSPRPASLPFKDPKQPQAQP